MIIQKKLFLTCTPNLLKRYGGDVFYIWDLVLGKVAYTFLSDEVENKEQLLRERARSQCRTKSFKQHLSEVKKTIKLEL